MMLIAAAFACFSYDRSLKAGSPVCFQRGPDAASSAVIRGEQRAPVTQKREVFQAEIYRCAWPRMRFNCFVKLGVKGPPLPC